MYDGGKRHVGGGQDEAGFPKQPHGVVSIWTRSWPLCCPHWSAMDGINQERFGAHLGQLPDTAVGK